MLHSNVERVVLMFEMWLVFSEAIERMAVLLAAGTISEWLGVDSWTAVYYGVT